MATRRRGQLFLSKRRGCFRARAPARFLTAELDGVGTVYTGSFVDGMFHGRYANTEPLMTFHEAFLSIPCAKVVGISARTGAVDDSRSVVPCARSQRGTLTFSNGGKYNATWERGRAVRDEGYVFSDGLHFTEGRHWDYCVGGDRRFYSEIVNGGQAQPRPTPP